MFATASGLYRDHLTRPGRARTDRRGISWAGWRGPLRVRQLAVASASALGAGPGPGLVDGYAGPQPGDLALSAELLPPHGQVMVGEPVYYQIRFTNMNTKTIIYRYGDEADMELRVVGPSGLRVRPARRYEGGLTRFHRLEPQASHRDRLRLLTTELPWRDVGAHEISLVLPGRTPETPIAVWRATLEVVPPDPVRLRDICEALVARTEARLRGLIDPRRALAAYAAQPEATWDDVDVTAREALAAIEDQVALPYLAQGAVAEGMTDWCPAVARNRSPRAAACLAALAASRRESLAEAARRAWAARPAEPATLPGGAIADPSVGVISAGDDAARPGGRRLEVAAANLLRDLPTELLGRRNKGFLPMALLDDLPLSAAG